MNMRNPNPRRQSRDQNVGGGQGQGQMRDHGAGAMRSSDPGAGGQGWRQMTNDGGAEPVMMSSAKSPITFLRQSTTDANEALAAAAASFSSSCSAMTRTGRSSLSKQRLVPHWAASCYNTVFRALSVEHCLAAVLSQPQPSPLRDER